MEYLFLRRKKTSSTSVRQKTLLYRAAGREWTARFSSLSDVRPADSLIYKGILYQLEIRRAFLDSSLSLKKLSMMLETNQTYLSNAVNRYFGCHLKELLNRYRVEYAKELLRNGGCPLGVTERFRFEESFLSGFRPSDGYDSETVCGAREEPGELGNRE